MTETLLELQAVEVSYGQARALNGVNLTVPEGRIISLLGGNASGKSTTMKTILGLVRPCRRTSCWAPPRGATKPASATTWLPSTTVSPAWGSDGARQPGPCRVGNSRCSPSPGPS